MKKILYRSKKNRVVGGVCGGIGEYFDIDPTLIRLLAILAFFFGGSGIIAYIIGWIIIPRNPSENTEQHFKSEQKIVDMEEGPKTSESKFKTTEEYQSVENGKNNSAKNRNVFLGLIFIFMGLIFMGTTLFPWFAWIAWSTYWPVILIIVGLVIMIRAI